MTIIFVFIILAILFCSYDIYKEKKAIKELNDFCQKKNIENEKVIKSITEKPKDIIYASEIMGSDMSIRYIGRYDSLDVIKAKQGDFASVNNIEYLYIDGKWYKVVNDIPPFNNNPIDY